MCRSAALMIQEERRCWPSWSSQTLCSCWLVRDSSTSLANSDGVCFEFLGEQMQADAGKAGIVDRRHASKLRVTDQPAPAFEPASTPAGRHLVLVSNRIPISFTDHDGHLSAAPASGGLVTALEPILREH